VKWLSFLLKGAVLVTAMLALTMLEVVKAKLSLQHNGKSGVALPTTTEEDVVTQLEVGEYTAEEVVV